MAQQAAPHAADSQQGADTRQGGDSQQGGDADRWIVEGIVAQAEEVDAAEDALFGSARGDELPAGWNGQEGPRRERIRAAQARLAEAQRPSAPRNRRPRRHAPSGTPRRWSLPLALAEAALATEGRDRQQIKIDAWEQAWEDAANNPGVPVPKGRAPVEDPISVRRAAQRLARARERVAHPDTAPRAGRTPRLAPAEQPRKKPAANITDPDSTIMPTRNGWPQAYNTHFAITADQIIPATGASTNPNDLVSYQTMTTAAQHAAQLTPADPEGITTLLYDASDATLTAPTPNRLIALGKTHSIRTAAREHPTAGPPPPEASPRQAMDHHLRTPEDTALYARRGTTAEPGTSNSTKLLTRSSRHSLATATSESQLTTTAFNLLKPHRTTPHNPRGPTGRPGTWSSIPTPAQPGVNEHQQDHQT